MADATIVEWSIGYQLGELIVGVSVECPLGCLRGRGRTRRPALHHHGLASLNGRDGGERAAHCLNQTGDYRLRFPAEVPAEVVAALLERENEGAMRRAAKKARTRA